MQVACCFVLGNGPSCSGAERQQQRELRIDKRIAASARELAGIPRGAATSSATTCRHMTRTDDRLAIHASWTSNDATR